MRSGRLLGVPVFARLMGLVRLMCALGSAARLRAAADGAAGAAAGGVPGRAAGVVLPAAGRDQGRTTAAGPTAARAAAVNVGASALVAASPRAVAPAAGRPSGRVPLRGEPVPNGRGRRNGR